MSLRLRLIVAFFFLSVVPLGAVTFYTYFSNAAALREAAGHEAQSLAGDLSQRMQLVTTQISDRVEHLMDVQREAQAQAAQPARTAAVAPPAPTAAGGPAKPVPPTPAETTHEDSVAAALGEVAMLLNNIEVRGLRQGGPPPGAPQGPGDGRGAGGGRGFRGGRVRASLHHGRDGSAQSAAHRSAGAREIVGACEPELRRLQRDDGFDES